MQPTQIRSRDNPRYKQWLRWAGSLRERRKAGVILLEGFHLLESWQAAGLPLQQATLIVAESLGLNAETASVPGLRCDISGAEWVELPDRLVASLAEAETPQGILAWVPLAAVQAAALCHDQDTVLLDGVQDPGNLGTLLRTAAAADVRQIVLSATCTSPWSGKALRAGQGAQCVLNIHEAVDLPVFLSAYQGQSCATTLSPMSQSLYAASAVHATGPLAWVFGSEGQGVSAPVLAAVQQHITIPMPGAVESLNVAAAAAICLFETLRRRGSDS